MLQIRELGFQTFLFSFLFVSIVGFIIRWKWNKAVRRKREILRLVAIAKEEAERIELEAASEYYYSNAHSSPTSPDSVFVSAPNPVPDSVRQSRECAVCHCPTTTRCARCKSVHYCSGKCQIIHWRLGHKDECYPPKNTFQFNGPESDTSQKTTSKRDEDETRLTAEEIKASSNTKPIGTYNEEPSTPNPYTCKDDGKSGQAPVISSSTSVSQLPVLNPPDGLEEPLLHNTARNGTQAEADVDDTKTRSPPLEHSASDVSVDSISHCGSTTSSHSSIEFLDCSKVSELSNHNSDLREGARESNEFSEYVQSSFSEGGEVHLAGNNKSQPSVLSNLSKQSIPHSQPQSPKPKKPLSGNERPTVKSSPKVVPEKPASVNMNIDSQALGHGGAKSLPSSSFGDNISSGGRVQPAPNLMSSERKVVQQFKVSKLSKHCVTEFGPESAEMNSYKMLFPYEQFVKLYHWEVDLRPCGLANCGNSCYANAVLQCLTFTRPLTAYLLQSFHSKACSKTEWCFMCEFERLVLKEKEGISSLSPIDILSQLQSIGSHLGRGREEDAHEFLRYVIDTMQSACLKEAGEVAMGPLAAETTLIGFIFGGYLRSKVTCMKCHGKSERLERMMDLTVEIHGKIRTLEEALRQFTATEILDGDNKYNCLRCRSYEKAKKKFTILEAPNVLTIALKRFEKEKCEKVKKPVKFPEFLDLFPYMSGRSDRSPIYRLYAVVVHLDTNGAASSGHYVSYVRMIQGKWFRVNDSVVKPVELEAVLSEEAYMLFYTRRSPRPPSFVRNMLIPNNGKVKDRHRSYEAVPSIHSGPLTSKARPPGSVVPSGGSCTAQKRVEDYPYWTTSAGSGSYESFDSFDRRFHPMHRIPKVDSSTDNSSLLSCSDDGSCSTESTRDSASTDDLPDYIHVEAGHSWNSPLRVFEDCDRFSSFPVEERHTSGFPETSEYHERNGVCSSQDGVSGQHGESLPNTSKYCRETTNNSNSSHSSRIRENERERRGCDPLDVNSGVSQRKFTRNRIVGTFY